MFIYFKRGIALGLALLMTLSLASCSKSCSGTESPADTTTDQTTQESSVPNLGGDDTTTPEDTTDATVSGDDEEAFVKPPLEHMIFGVGSYVQGENLIATVGREQLPEAFKSPLTMYIKNYTEWQNFYGGLPRSKMDDAFVQGIAGINEPFFKSKALLVVIVEARSVDYTHEVKDVSYANGKVAVQMTTHMVSNATNEVGYACIIIPINPGWVGFPVTVGISKELNS